MSVSINSGYGNLQGSYLFSTIAKKISDYQAKNPDADIIRLGIGDVTLPICKAAVKAMTEAVDELGHKDTFKGYGPEQGYPFLRESIRKYYEKRGIALEGNEIFVSDGAKSDLGNILDLFSSDNKVLVCDPVYSVYVDTNIMASREIEYIDAVAENDFLPMPYDGLKADIIYICSPCNPTGAVYTKKALKAWVDYANANGAVILFDAAYEAFIEEPQLPRSIFEIDGAKTCAIEFCSFSKTAGFTGTRCGYTVVPEALTREGASLNKMWLRRQTTKFNGVPYIVQRGAAAVLTDEGYAEAMENISYYKNNAKLVAATMDKLGIKYTGGKNSPYIWLKYPGEMGSWEMFEYILENAQVATTPGAGFGVNGEGFLRITAFGDKDRTAEAMKRIEKLFSK